MQCVSKKCVASTGGLTPANAKYGEPSRASSSGVCRGDPSFETNYPTVKTISLWRRSITRALERYRALSIDTT